MSLRPATSSRPSHQVEGSSTLLAGDHPSRQRPLARRQRPAAFHDAAVLGQIEEAPTRQSDVETGLDLAARQRIGLSRGFVDHEDPA